RTDDAGAIDAADVCIALGRDGRMVREIASHRIVGAGLQFPDKLTTSYTMDVFGGSSRAFTGGDAVGFLKINRFVINQELFHALVGTGLFVKLDSEPGYAGQPAAEQ